MMSRSGYQRAIEGIAAAVLYEAFKREVSTAEVMSKVHQSVDNKMKCVAAANHKDELDAITYVMAQINCVEPVSHVNCRCSISGEWGQTAVPKKIIYSGGRTIVMWDDGTKTIVKCADDQEFDEYSGFVAAFAKKVFGSTSGIKKMINRLRAPEPNKPAKNKLNSDTTDGNI